MNINQTIAYLKEQDPETILQYSGTNFHLKRINGRTYIVPERCRSTTVEELIFQLKPMSGIVYDNHEVLLLDVYVAEKPEDQAKSIINYVSGATDLLNVQILEDTTYYILMLQCKPEVAKCLVSVYG